VPIANDTVNAMVPTPIVPVAPASTMAASTGPAQGTNNTPRARPRPNPLRPSLALNCGIRANGFSRISSNCGKISPIPMTVSATMPIHRNASCGRCSSDSNADPASVTTLKLTTRPAITRYGRSDSAPRRFGLTLVATPPGAASAGATSRALCAPEKKITGSTGRMHGEMPVIRPPRNPITARVNITRIRRRSGRRWAPTSSA